MHENWTREDYVKRYNSVYPIGEGEMRGYLELLQIVAEDTVVDFGCGQGDMLLFFSQHVKEAVGIDSSRPQAALARARLANSGNVRIIESSFLDCDLQGCKFTKGFARKALHHLTDPEKGVFFARISPYFERNSLFLLEDGIFDFDRGELQSRMPNLLEEAARYYGNGWETKKKDFLVTVQEEFVADFSAWEQAMSQGGFALVKRWQKTSFYGTMLAIKER